MGTESLESWEGLVGRSLWGSEALAARGEGGEGLLWALGEPELSWSWTMCRCQHSFACSVSLYLAPAVCQASTGHWRQQGLR